MTTAPTPEEPWTPDERLLSRARGGGGLSVKELSEADRALVVAALSRDGWTAQEIATRLRCSLRLIWQIKASHMLSVMEYVLDMQHKNDAANGVAKIELDLVRKDAAAHQVEARRAYDQRNDLVEQLSLERGKKNTNTMRDANKIHARQTCRQCVHMMGKLESPADIRRGAHALCDWARTSDWLVIANWAKGIGEMSGS